MDLYAYSNAMNAEDYPSFGWYRNPIKALPLRSFFPCCLNIFVVLKEIRLLYDQSPLATESDEKRIIFACRT